MEEVEEGSSTFPSLNSSAFHPYTCLLLLLVSYFTVHFLCFRFQDFNPPAKALVFQRRYTPTGKNELLISIVTYPNKSEIPDLAQTYGIEIQKHGADVLILGREHEEPGFQNILLSEMKPLEINCKWTRKYLSDLHYNMMRITQNSLEYFLSHPQYRWYSRTNDDVWYNLKTFPSFYHKLQNDFYPEEEEIFIGHCIEFEKSRSYPQGASWIMLRKLAEKFYSNFQTFLKYVQKEMDDKALGHLLRDMGVSYIGDPRFLLHAYNPWHKGIEYKFDQITLSKCPNEKEYKDIQKNPKRGMPRCPHEIHPLNQFVNYHVMNKMDMKARMHQFQTMQNAPEDIKVYRNGLWSYLCIDNGSKQILYNTNYRRWGPGC